MATQEQKDKALVDLAMFASSCKITPDDLWYSSIMKAIAVAEDV